MNNSADKTRAVRFMLGCALGRIVGEADKWLRNAEVMHLGDDPYWYIHTRNQVHALFVREAKVEAGFYV